MTVITWILAAIALVGTVLNVRQDRRCFFLWLFSNGGFTAVNFARGDYAQGTLFAVYLVLAVLGARQWQKSRQII